MTYMTDNDSRKVDEVISKSDNAAGESVAKSQGEIQYNIIQHFLHNHKGAIAPLYIGIVVVGQHRSHTFAKSAFPWQ